MGINKTLKKYLFKRPLLNRFGRFFCALFLFSKPIHSHAQLMDDLRDCFSKKPALYGTWDSRYTFISNQFATVSSVKGGLDFNGVGKIGLGYNWYKGKINNMYTNGEGTYNYLLKMRYGTFFFEYTYFLSKYWEASIPIQIGAGWISFDRTDTEVKENLHGRMIFFYEPMSVIQYRFLRYFAAGGGIGIRLAITKNDLFFNNYNSPVFVVRTKFYFGELFRDIFGKEPKEFLRMK